MDLFIITKFKYNSYINIYWFIIFTIAPLYLIYYKHSQLNEWDQSNNYNDDDIVKLQRWFIKIHIIFMNYFHDINGYVYQIILSNLFKMKLSLN